MDTETETVNEERAELPPESASENISDNEAEVAQNITEERTEEQKVPLSALQKERRKRQETEQRLRFYEEMQAKQMAPQPIAEDESQYEAVTKREHKQDLDKTEFKLLRAVEEKAWLRNNPDKAAIINEKLEDFLKQKPHLAQAIEAVTNRYEEAWELMDKLLPKPKPVSKPVVAEKKVAPGSPAGIPKAAGINQAVDIMRMSDKEFSDWRAAQRKRR